MATLHLVLFFHCAHDSFDFSNALNENSCKAVMSNNA